MAPAVMHVIEVFRDRGVAYVAWYSQDRYPEGHRNAGQRTWETNTEVDLSEVEKQTGPLADGYQEPWIEIKDVPSIIPERQAP